MKTCIQINPEDNVCITIGSLEPGDTINCSGTEIIIREKVPAYHKVSLTPIQQRQPIIRYGVPVGESTQTIEQGCLVHLHNMKSTYLPTCTRKE